MSEPNFDAPAEEVVSEPQGEPEGGEPQPAPAIDPAQVRAKIVGAQGAAARLKGQRDGTREELAQLKNVVAMLFQKLSPAEPGEELPDPATAPVQHVVEAVKRHLDAELKPIRDKQKTEAEREEQEKLVADFHARTHQDTAAFGPVLAQSLGADPKVAMDEYAQAVSWAWNERRAAWTAAFPGASPQQVDQAIARYDLVEGLWADEGVNRAAALYDYVLQMGWQPLAWQGAAGEDANGGQQPPAPPPTPAQRRVEQAAQRRRETRSLGGVGGGASSKTLRFADLVAGTEESRRLFESEKKRLGGFTALMKSYGKLT